MNNLMSLWRSGVMNIWSNKWACARPGELPCRLTFDVDWVQSNEHHSVDVVPGPTRSNMGQWDTLDTGNVAAHECGHMLGNVDEYSDSNCPARSPVNTGNVMDNNSNNVPSRMMQRFADNIGSFITQI
jgi:hypothetical protein